MTFCAWTLNVKIDNQNAIISLENIICGDAFNKYGCNALIIIYTYITEFYWDELFLRQAFAHKYQQPVAIKLIFLSLESFFTAISRLVAELRQGSDS
ncbi:hypothetical protein GCM10009193_31020 [Shewanella aestuarii]|nr:hypothetical protein GCM10009193_31020 [Shewanella aestuarii]